MNADVDTVLVIPCYNEAARLDVETLRQHAKDAPTVGFVLVNDGSSDATLGILRGLEGDDPDHFTVIDQQPNAGKAAAVHRGMVHALRAGVTRAGYWDADMATPLSELPRFIDILDTHPHCDIVWGARVQMLGRSIRRSAVRHYLGRVFATLVSILLRLPTYDTQCGAKLFRVTPDVTRLFVGPFLTRWTFDVEIVARLTRLCRDRPRMPPEQCIYELPLMQWHDVEGSSVVPGDALGALADLMRIYQNYLSTTAPPLPALPAAQADTQRLSEGEGEGA